MYSRHLSKTATAYIAPLVCAILSVFGSVCSAAAVRDAAAPMYVKTLANLGVAEISKVQPGLVPPKDAVGCQFETEIALAVRLGYLTVARDKKFHPDMLISAGDFTNCIRRAFKKAGCTGMPIPDPDQPKECLNKMQAAKLLAISSLTAEQLDATSKKCGNPAYYLSDFGDGDKISRWALQYVAVGVYNGWIPDAHSLLPDQFITRAYAAALLVRAFPDPSPDAFTGLIIQVKNFKLDRAQSLRIVSDDDSGTELYIQKEWMPSLAYIQAPGVVSYCETEKDAMDRKVGLHPIVVEAKDVRKGADGRWEILITQEDSQKIREADETGPSPGLFLRKWRVSIVGQFEKSAPAPRVNAISITNSDSATSTPIDAGKEAIEIVE